MDELEERVCVMCGDKFECYKDTTDICQKCRYEALEEKK